MGDWLSSETKQVARSLLKKGGELSGVLVQLTASTSTIGRVGAALGVANALIGEAPKLSAQFAECPVLELDSSLQRTVMTHVRGLLKPGQSSGDEQVWRLPVGSGCIAWIVKGTEPLAPWLVRVSQEEASSALGRALWESIGTRASLTVHRWGELGEFHRDELTQSLPSKRSRDLADELRLYRTAGTSRAMLLYGPPRTGKSYIVRDVAERLGSYSLRVTADCFGAERAILSAAKFLRPQAVIIDDICRTPTSSSGMLSAVEQLREIVPTVLATANYTDKIDPALMAPGRFDRCVEILDLDEETFGVLTGDLDPPTRDVLRKAPAGYINEFLVQRQVEGHDVAMSRLAELLERAEKTAEAKCPQPNPAHQVKS